MPAWVVIHQQFDDPLAEGYSLLVATEPRAGGAWLFRCSRRRPDGQPGIGRRRTQTAAATIRGAAPPLERTAPGAGKANRRNPPAHRASEHRHSGSYNAFTHLTATSAEDRPLGQSRR